jgi:alpha-tubulin suppressor-like RCC1 family protein
MIRALTFATLTVLVAASSAAAQAVGPAVAFGTRHAVALRTNGEVLTWGENVSCQLGRGSRGTVDPRPVVVMRNAIASA